MNEAPLSRLLELVERELDADDARLELGGEEPTDERFVWCALPNGWRLVALYASPPLDRAARQERIEALASTFALATQSISAPVQAPTASLRGLATRRLDTELFALAARAGAAQALVIDESSPVIWGTSASRHEGEDVASVLRVAELAGRAATHGVELAPLLALDPGELRAALAARALSRELSALLVGELVPLRERVGRWSGQAWRQYLLSARAIARVRRDELEEARRGGHVRETHRAEDFGYVARSFATIYLVLLVFDGAFSELHAEAALIHALPAVERLVLALPPVEPPSGGTGKSLRLVR